MNKLTSLFSLTLVAILALSFGSRLPVQAKGDAGGRFAKLVAAVKALEDAKEYMENSPSEFKGHKAATIEECDKAIAQLKKAME